MLLKALLPHHGWRGCPDIVIHLFQTSTPLRGDNSEPNQDPYCFVEFYDHESAAAALAAMNKRMCLGRSEGKIILQKEDFAVVPSNFSQICR
ncbi:hypothetical protein DPMN_167410 [Dreissena polymorpha]|uniref:RRM domain-containing protein n=1 Tax=Dreissena polymorpha TaxID=45954 RepID=A0A9D4EYT0_DREPO|nr:hypothetical protein DPMN_167410 [Dreissena polymorpha]